jgi:hypothetical protein
VNDAVQESASKPSSPSDARTEHKAKSNPLWTISALLFLLFFTVALSMKTYELYYGSAEDQAMKEELAKIHRAAQMTLDQDEARLRVELLSQLPESERSVVARSLSALSSRPRAENLNAQQRFILLNARQQVLEEAKALLKDGRLTKLERGSFLGLLRVALDDPKRLTVK